MIESGLCIQEALTVKKHVVIYNNVNINNLFMPHMHSAVINGTKMYF